MASEWHGDKTNGIEIRSYDDFVDEVVMYVDGQVVLHIENMSDQCYWMGLYTRGFEAHCNIFSKNGRSHVSMNAEGTKSDTFEKQAAMFPPTAPPPTSQADPST